MVQMRNWCAGVKNLGPDLRRKDQIHKLWDKSLLVVVCYMYIMAGGDAARDNARKYAIVKNVVQEN